MTRNIALLRALLALGLVIAGHASAAITTRTETIMYSDNPGKWVMGQVASVACVAPAECTPAWAPTGIVESQTTFDASTALPVQTYAFGKLQQTLAYNADGTLAAVRDGNNNITALTGWKRGIPQTIHYPVTSESPAGAYRSGLVDDLGRLTAVTDEVASKTCYGYDMAGRLSGVTYTSEVAPDTCDGSPAAAWTPASRSFVRVPSAEYGLPAGHWRQTVATGNGKVTTYYDALWHPVLALTEDAANVLSRSFVVSRYDGLGRSTFTSYPVGTLTSVNDTLAGVTTTYDALGRITSSQQDSELGGLTSSIEYLAGFQTRVTNPRGFATTTTYQAFDSPSTDSPVAISLPEGAYTTIQRDVFGKPTSVSRSGL